MSLVRTLLGGVASLLVGVIAACSGAHPNETPAPLCENALAFNVEAMSEVDRKTFELKTLEVVDSSVVGGATTLPDRRGLNSTSGPWSFSHVISELTPLDRNAGDLTYDWLMTWMGPHTVNGYLAQARTDAMPKVICPWLKRTPSNQCDKTCGTCAEHELDLAFSPFRLIGIAFRPDLAETQPTTPAGEGRLLFGAFTSDDLSKGPADDPAATSMNMTVIFEFRLPTSKGQTREYWARQFATLARYTAFDEDYRAAMQAVTDQFVARGADPSAPQGAAVAQIRTNEREFDWTWQLREFHLEAGGLALRTTANNPDSTLNNSPNLSQFVTSHADDVNANRMLLPAEFLGGETDQFTIWQLPQIDESLRRAFAGQTCNGCHHDEHKPIDLNFHVSPHRDGVTKLSAFLNGGGADELLSRSRALQRGLCATR